MDNNFPISHQDGENHSHFSPNDFPISHQDGENRSHFSPNQEYCHCRPCFHNIRNKICVHECLYVHKNEEGFCICKHGNNVTNRSSDSRVQLEKKLSVASLELENLIKEYHFLRIKYSECDQAYHTQSLLVTQLNQENDYLRQQLDKHSQPKQLTRAFHQPTRMVRGGYRGGQG